MKEEGKDWEMKLEPPVRKLIQKPWMAKKNEKSGERQ